MNMHVKNGPRPGRRRERQAARRAAFHTERMERAASPKERFSAAADYLTSAVAHALHPARAARTAAAEVAEEARQAIAHAEFKEASRRLHLARLAASGTQVHRLSTALMVLRSALAKLPEADRDRMYEHYATELAREARQIRWR